MKTQCPFHFSLNQGGKRMVLAEHPDARTFLAFSDTCARFAAVKVYNLDPYHDAAYRQGLKQRLAEVQSAFSHGIAFPFEMGVEDERIFQLMELLPGHSLQETLEWHGPLSSRDVFLVARKVVEQLIDARQRYKLSPTLTPDQVMIWHTGSAHWKLGFADYDLRKEYGAGGLEEERAAFGQLALLLYYIGTGDLRSTVPTKTGELAASWLKRSNPELWWFYLKLFRYANAPELCSLQELKDLVESHCNLVAAKLEVGSPPLSRNFLEWLPQNGEFPQPFESRGRNLDPWQTSSYAALDSLRETSVQLHLLPPQSMTAGEEYERLFQQKRQIACEDVPWQLPVKSVMVDPSCRVVAERASHAIPLSVVLEKREQFTAQEAVILLEKANLALSQAERTWTESEDLPSLSLNDLMLVPSPEISISNSWSEKYTWLADPEAYELKLRAFKTNPFFEETPSAAPLWIEGGTGLAARLYQPEHSFAALAYRLISRVMDCEEAPMPEPVALMFRKILALRRSNEGYLRRYLTAKLRRMFGIKGKARELPPEFALAKSKVGLAAVSASASVLVVVGLCLAFLR